MTIRRVLVANRGEIAIRIIRACREAGIEAVAIYSDADVDALHVQAAERAVHVGPVAASESYLNIAAILRAAAETACDAIHPGYGFLSERAAFARACEEAGIIFIGPASDTIDRMGSKVGARELMEGAGVPVVPGLAPRDQSDAGLLAAVRAIGFPALVKASAGGGGKGMRTLHDAADAAEMIAGARREAQAAFGDGTLYVERLVARPRHVEIQVFGDAHGNVVHLFERECSIQRRHQKVIEESPSPALTPALRARMGEAAVAAARAVHYRSAGTVEFLLEGSGDAAQFYFLEMNTRLQVEHPVTEAVTGVDLVHAQLAVAAGATLPWTQGSLTQRGHAIECRVYAEDPANGFLPQAGRLLVYREPAGPGIRVDGGVAEGGAVPVAYDPLLAKLIVTAESRGAAIDRALAALRRYPVLGIRTNIPFLIRVLDHQAFRSGGVHTGFIDQHLDALTARPEPPPGIAAAAVAASDRDGRPERRAWDPWEPGLPTAGKASAHSARHLIAADRDTRWVFLEGEVYEIETRRRGRRRASAHHSSLAAPMPATVTRVNVEAGAVVRKGETLLVLEAMKMELPVRAPADGTVTAISCRVGEMVQAGAVLAELE
ncbi:MAG TPA: acetyl-CoA carboxylase biotin carboxylase subunit [Vicinamibacterales bacterium]|nr:acetyl-CoA carboxylase biotin carboxylase subunit [Vicinamibacterales bacterium]